MRFLWRAGELGAANGTGSRPHLLDRVAFGMWVWLVTCFGCSVLLAVAFGTGLVGLGEDGCNFALGAFAAGTVSMIVAVVTAIRMRKR